MYFLYNIRQASSSSEVYINIIYQKITNNSDTAKNELVSPHRTLRESFVPLYRYQSFSMPHAFCRLICLFTQFRDELIDFISPIPPRQKTLILDDADDDERHS